MTATVAKELPRSKHAPYITFPARARKSRIASTIEISLKKGRLDTATEAATAVEKEKERAGFYGSRGNSVSITSDESSQGSITASNENGSLRLQLIILKYTRDARTSRKQRSGRDRWPVTVRSYR